MKLCQPVTLEEKRQAYLSVSQGEGWALQRWRVRTITRGYHIQEVYPCEDPPKTCHFSMPSCVWSFSMSLMRSQAVFSSDEALLAIDWLSINVQNKEWNSWSWFAWALLVEEKDLVMKMSIAGMMIFFVHLTFFWVEESMMSGICTSSRPPWWNVGSWFQHLSEETNCARRWLDLGECKGLIPRDKMPAYLELYFQRFCSQWRLVELGGESWCPRL